MKSSSSLHSSTCAVRPRTPESGRAAGRHGRPIARRVVGQPRSTPARRCAPLTNASSRRDRDALAASAGLNGDVVQLAPSRRCRSPQGPNPFRALRARCHNDMSHRGCNRCVGLRVEGLPSVGTRLAPARWSGDMVGEGRGVGADGGSGPRSRNVGDDEVSADLALERDTRRPAATAALALGPRVYFNADSNRRPRAHTRRAACACIRNPRNSSILLGCS